MRILFHLYLLLDPQLTKRHVQAFEGPVNVWAGNSTPYPNMPGVLKNFKLVSQQSTAVELEDMEEEENCQLQVASCKGADLQIEEGREIINDDLMIIVIVSF